MRYGFPIFFAVAGSTTTAVAAVNHGPVRVYWALGAVAATAGSAVFGVFKDRQASASASAAVTAKAQLATALNRAGEPLLTALGNVTAAKTPQDRRAAVDVLVARTIDIAHSQCGRDAGTKPNVRSVYYAVIEDRLERKGYAGRQSNAPRRQFVLGASPHDNEAIRIARSEEVLLVADLEDHPPPHFLDNKGRSYKSFIAAPGSCRRDQFWDANGRR
jgi:hypothetical protein